MTPFAWLILLAGLLGLLTEKGLPSKYTLVRAVDRFNAQAPVALALP